MNNHRIKFVLDSGDPDEYREIANLAKKAGSELWGGTTNPTLIAKKVSKNSPGKKFTQKEAFELQKAIAIEIASIVPGAVSAEVYSDPSTPGEEMTEQGHEIASWHENIVVKLPTTIQGFKARTALRRSKILTNNTLVFSQQQIFAICLHEEIMQKMFGPLNDKWPPFISPFVGRLEDVYDDGLHLVEQGMKIKQQFSSKTFMLAASIRRPEHIKFSIDIGSELITAPASSYREWFEMSEETRNLLDTTSYRKGLSKNPTWTPTVDIRNIETAEQFMRALESNKLTITHHLTEKGLVKFAEDWKSIIS